MGANEEIPLDQIMELLKNAVDWKLLSTGTSQSMRALEEAKKIIKKNSIGAPWKHLIDYRMAHLKMRTAQSVSELEDVDELFTSASKAKSLGPLPRIYRIAVMHRLIGNNEVKKKNRALRTVFNSLIDQVDQYTREIETFEREETITRIQHSLFNMVELATYFTGYPYEGFEGRGHRTEKNNDEDDKNNSLRGLYNGAKFIKEKEPDPFYDMHYNLKGWRLIGSVEGLPTFKFPGEVALEYMETHMESKKITPPCIAFRLSADKKYFHWNFNLQRNDKGYVWEKLSSNSKFLYYLTAINCSESTYERRLTVGRIFTKNDKATNSHLRQTKKRCAEAIAERINTIDGKNSLDDKEIFKGSKTGDSIIPSFNSKISFLGAFESDVTRTFGN